jgi:hypothetical protein
LQSFGSVRRFARAFLLLAALRVFREASLLSDKKTLIESGERIGEVIGKDSRPALDRLMKDARARKFDVVIVAAPVMIAKRLLAKTGFIQGRGTPFDARR